MGMVSNVKIMNQNLPKKYLKMSGLKTNEWDGME